MNEPMLDGSRVSGCTIHTLPTRAVGRPAVLDSVTLVIGGRHLGTFTLDAPYAGEADLRLYVVSQEEPSDARRSRRLDCLITDTALD